LIRQPPWELKAKHEELSILVPTYEERDNLPILLERIQATLIDDENYEVIVIDDNSPDGTGKLADELARTYTNVKVVHRRRKGRLSLAIIDGLRIAEGTLFSIMDADLQHPPELLAEMLEKALHGADLVVASRYTDGGGLESWSLLRKTVSKGATLLAHVLLPRTQKVRDPLSGYFSVRKQVLDCVNLDPLGYKILLEILVKGKHSRVIEVPYVFRPRTKGKSKLKPSEYVNYVLHLFRLVMA